MQGLFKLKNLIIFLIVIAVWLSTLVVAVGVISKKLPNLVSGGKPIETSKIVQEESIVTDVVDRVSPSVVTVSAQTQKRKVLNFSPYGGFSTQTQQPQQQDIGSGFIVSADGLIVTNKHVVADTSLKYKVITKDNKEYDTVQISRDPTNDIAIIKIDANNLTPIELGDSSNLKVGQFVVAIGTALGEFRNTVTTGVVSGLGRGISAGDPLAGAVEQLDNVIQTDAAINPGNSGGPLLNSSGQVIGINVAVAAGAQNIGFAIPVSTVRDAISQFSANGKFPAKAFLGVQYQMVTKQAALLNSVPQGALVGDVVAGSAADEAGIKV
ncbi:MAG TPA: trypsin-like peptidase domain-containing protein, partial [Candidatus Saccharimonadales bacterium]|nr:trypsin-like peptidase domain-containing protein [Candidatus Saccharimonadales bacterium]